MDYMIARGYFANPLPFLVAQGHGASDAKACMNSAMTFDLPKIERADDLLAAFSTVVTSMAAGDLGADEAALIASVLEAKRKTIETVDIEKRLAAIEAKDAKK